MFYINTLSFLLVLKYAFNLMGKDNEKKADRIYLFISSAILAFITGFRGKYVGADTMGYIRNFLKMDDYTWGYALSEKSGRFEIGYKFFTKLSGFFTDSENVFLLIVAVLFAVCLGIYIDKNSKNRFLSILLYYTVSGFSFQLSGIRQVCAMAIVLVSFEFIKERKLWKFLGAVLIASLFHKSSISVLPMYFIAYIKMNFKNFLVFLTSGILMWIFRQPFLDFANKVLGYDVSAIGFEGGAIYVVLMYAITIFVSYIYMNWLKNQDKNNVVFFNITFFSFFVYILRYFVQIAERVSFYYQFAFIILLPNIVEAIEDKKTRRFIKTGVVVLACFLFCYRCIRGMNSTHHYYFFWQNP